MTIKVGSNEFPLPMGGRALSYVFEPGQVACRNGLGEIQLAGGARVTWTWAVLTVEEYRFLVHDLCQDKASQRWEVIGGTILYNDQQAEQTFSNCVVLRPTYKEFSGDLYRDVTLVIDSLY
jgi:hypothetical protein